MVLPLVNAGEYFAGYCHAITECWYFVGDCLAISECWRLFCWLLSCHLLRLEKIFIAIVMLLVNAGKYIVG